MGAVLTQPPVIWSAAGILVALVFLGYLRKFRRRVRRDLERKREAAELGIDVPVAQYPFVDSARCIGCGGCVEVCPQGDVLGMVRGLAVVVNGLRCIGIAHCEDACPVGAIEVGLGDIKGRADIPVLDESYQSSVPGLYVAGELSGLALVRNAIRQGREAAQQIASSVREHGANGDGVLDVAIVGAGPAGLSAGFTAAALGLSYAVLEREGGLGGTVLKYPRRKMVLTEPVEMSPWGELTRGEYQKEELLGLFSAMVRDAELRIDFGRSVESVSKRNGHFELVSGACRYRARAVLLALGRRGTPRKLVVPGEDLAKVMYRLTDAESYRGDRILVVGGGDSAVEAAIGLARQAGNVITLSYRKPMLVRVKRKNQTVFDELVAKGRIEPLFSSTVLEIRQDSVRLEVADRGEVVIDNQWVFVLIGGEPPFAFVKSLGVRFGDSPADDKVAMG